MGRGVGRGPHSPTHTHTHILPLLGRGDGNSLGKALREKGSCKRSPNKINESKIWELHRAVVLEGMGAANPKKILKNKLENH